MVRREMKTGMKNATFMWDGSYLLPLLHSFRDLHFTLFLALSCPSVLSLPFLCPSAAALHRRTYHTLFKVHCAPSSIRHPSLSHPCTLAPLHSSFPNFQEHTLPLHPPKHPPAFRLSGRPGTAIQKVEQSPLNTSAGFFCRHAR